MPRLPPLPPILWTHERYRWIHWSGRHGTAHGAPSAQGGLAARRAQPQPRAGRCARRGRRRAGILPAGRGPPPPRPPPRLLRAMAPPPPPPARRRARRAAALGAAMLDAPVSGGEIGAV